MRCPVHRDPIGLAVGITGMGQLQGEVTLIAEQQGPAAVCIQSSDRMQTSPEMRRDEIQHRRPSLRVMAAADHTGRFVEQKHPVRRPAGHRGAVHRDPVDGGIGLIADGCHLSVHDNTTLSQQIFRLAS